MIRLGRYIPNPRDATSFYRGAIPLNQLQKIRKDILKEEFNPTTFFEMDELDVVFMQRPYDEKHLRLAQMAKEHHKPLWMDFDDFLFQVPSDNPTSDRYRQNRDNLKQIIPLADVVTVSTQHLKDMLQLSKSPLNRNVHVVPNSLNDNLFRIKPECKDHKLVSWRGSETHQKDCAVYSAEIIEIANSNPEWVFNWIGWNPWFITDCTPHESTIIVESMDIMEYFAFMRMNQPAIHIVPLDDSNFNRCKSNIAWIEATYAGAIVLAPDWPEWRMPGVTTYKDQADFKDQLQSMMNISFELRKSLHSLSWNHIQENFLLSKNNLKRLQILDALTGPPTPIHKIHGKYPEGGGPTPPKDESMMVLE